MTTRSLQTGILHVFVAVAAILAPWPAAAQWTTNGVHIAPSDAAQAQVDLAPDGAGGVYVTWQSGSVYLTHLTATGVDATGWPPAGDLVFGNCADPMLAADGIGGVYLTASDPHWYTSSVFVVRIGADNTLSPGWVAGGVKVGAVASTVGPGQISPNATLGPSATVFAPTIAMSSDGGPMLAWIHLPRIGEAEYMKASSLTSSGQAIANWSAGGVTVGYCDYPPPAVCSDGAGGMFLAYTSRPGYVDPPAGVIVHHYNADGTHLSVMACSVLTVQDSPGLVSDGAGGAFVFWQDPRDAPLSRPFVQHVLPNGSYAPGWPPEGLAISAFGTAAGTIRYNGGYTPHAESSVTSDGAGGAYIAWTDFRNDPAGDVYAQHVLGDGSFAPGWPVNGLALCTAPGGQIHPTVSEDGAGGLLVCWQDARSDSSDIYAQHVDAAGTLAPSWPDGGIAVCTAESSQVLPRITSDGAGGAIVAWLDHRGQAPQVYTSHITYDAVVPTLASLVSLKATSERVSIDWFAGSNRGSITIERNAQGSGWISIASVRADGTGRVAYEDRDVVPGGRYGYRLGLTSNGSEIRVGETWVTVPGAAFTLQAIRPNPISGRAVAVTFAVPAPGRALLDVLDVGGRRVASRQIDASHAGSFTESLGDLAALPNGVYVIRLSQAGRSVAERACVVH